MSDVFESDWFNERPPAVQDAIRFRPPGKYLLASTNQIVHTYSYDEKDDGSCDTCTVYITTTDNPEQAFTPFPNRKVFGINLVDLIPLN